MVGHSMQAKRLSWLPGSARCSPAIRLSIASHRSGPISSSNTTVTASATARARLLLSFCSFKTPREPSTTRRVLCATARSRFASRPLSAESNSEVFASSLRKSSCTCSTCVEALNLAPWNRLDQYEQRDQSTNASPNLASTNLGFIEANPRYRRDFTVESGARVTFAISSRERSS